jgi:hypothetical protein
VSKVSSGFTKVTRLLKHGCAGQIVDSVTDSWMEKPCARSSRVSTFITPPGLPG